MSMAYMFGVNDIRIQTLKSLCTTDRLSYVSRAIDLLVHSNDPHADIIF